MTAGCVGIRFGESEPIRVGGALISLRRFRCAQRTARRQRLRRRSTATDEGDSSEGTNRVARIASHERLCFGRCSARRQRETRRTLGSAAGCNTLASRPRCKASRWCETTRTKRVIWWSQTTERGWQHLNSTSATANDDVDGRAYRRIPREAAGLPARRIGCFEEAPRPSRCELSGNRQREAVRSFA